VQVTAEQTRRPEPDPQGRGQLRGFAELLAQLLRARSGPLDLESRETLRGLERRGERDLQGHLRPASLGRRWKSHEHVQGGLQLLYPFHIRRAPARLL